MNLMEVTSLSNGPILELIRWLQAQNLLASPLRCLPCNQAMELTRRNRNHVDGHLWRCSVCRHKTSLRAGSLFAEFKRISLGKLLLLIYFWSLRELRTTAARMVGVTNSTAGNVFKVLRHYCKRDLQDNPILPFGGNVHIVKCDESQFTHQSKYRRGRRPRDDTWVFGVFSTEHSPCRGYYQVVAQRDRATLAAILQRVLLPGSEVHTDDWAGYRNLELHVPNVRVHRTVVHRDNFVDPLTGIHTQEPESAWARVKYHIKREKGIRRVDVQDFLDEQMWRDWRGLDNVFNNVFVVIRNYYPL